MFLSGPGCVSPLHGDDTLDMPADQAQLQEADRTFFFFFKNVVKCCYFIFDLTIIIVCMFSIV